MDSLLVLSECRSALAEAKELKDILGIRDRAEFFRAMLKARGESLAAQNEMAEVTALAEIKIGKAIVDMPKAKAGRKNKNRPDGGPIPLADLGIARGDSERWQTMAKAERLVAKLVKQATDEGKDFTRAMVYREGKRIKDGDKPPKPPKELGDWIAHLRRRVESVYDEAPQSFRDIMANVLRTLAENVDTWESSDDGSDRGTGKDSASAA